MTHPPRDGSGPLRSLDFLYTPSRDVAADIGYFVDVLGGELVFAIEAMGTRVAMIRLGDDAPAVVLTDHLDGDRTILVYRVENLPYALEALESRGWTRAATIDLPPGPACAFETPGGRRLAVYEAARPQVLESFQGRRDFS